MSKIKKNAKKINISRPASDENVRAICERGVVEVIEREHLENDLRRGSPLRVKLGADPSAPDLHLGHAVVLRKLKEFQELGHTVVFIIGDYTARIGDPTGKSKTRPQLAPEIIAENAKSYFAQVGKVLDLSRADIHFNSEWFNKMTLGDIVNLLSKFTVARIIERDDFSKRLKGGADVNLHELLYPAMQAHDSVAVRASVEIGGTDQKFNMLAGRDLQRKLGLPEQDVITCPLLLGTDGAQKMSKSLGNYIGLREAPEEMYGKIMSIPDTLILHYFELAAFSPPEEMAKIRALLESRVNPRDLKMKLAREIVTLWHESAATRRAEEHFRRVFQAHETPEDVSEIKIKEKSVKLTDALVAAKLALSKAEARRLIEQKAVKVSGALAEDPQSEIKITKEGVVIQKGKRGFVRLRRDA